MKYICAEKLIAEIERFKATEYVGDTLGDDVANCALDYVLEEIIPSLQQKQPESTNWKFVFPKYLYARTKDNKTIDISYAPQDMAAIEYVRNDSIERHEVDLGIQTMVEEIRKCGCNPNEFDIARHFYELGLNARKEE